MTSQYSVKAICATGGILREGYRIQVEENRFGEVAEASPDGEWKDCIAVPGLIQSHIHLCQTLFRGMAEGRELLPWLEERIWPLEASHDEDTLATSVIVSLRELFAGGCTGLLDMGSIELSETTVDILRRSGMRAHAGSALMDVGPDWIARDLSWLKEEARRVSRRCGGLVSYAYAPRFALSCSNGVWDWMREVPQGSVKTTHAAEAPGEMASSIIGDAGGNVRFLHDRGFTGPKTLLAHCVHLQPGELDILAGSRTGVVHCPWTNLKLGSGVADIPAFASAGVPVLLGSDGAACNNRLSAACDARLAMALASVKGTPSSIPGSFMLHSLTTLAAERLGWENTGTISRGGSADMVLLELKTEDWDELELVEDPLRWLLELDWSSRVRLTMVSGRTVFMDGEYPTLPEPPLSVGDARLRVQERAISLRGSGLSAAEVEPDG